MYYCCHRKEETQEFSAKGLWFCFYRWNCELYKSTANARFSGLVKRVLNCSQFFILTTHISTWTSFLLILLRKEHITREIEQYERKTKNLFHGVIWFFIHFWCMNRYHLIRNGDKVQIRSNPLKESSLSLPITSFMHRPNPGDPQRTSNISQKTQQKRKSATETRNVLLLI